MKEEMRTIGYLCPRCRKPVMQQRSRFALAASGAIVQCECGKSELQFDFDGEKFRISVPCGVCNAGFWPAVQNFGLYPKWEVHKNQLQGKCNTISCN